MPTLQQVRATPNLLTLARLLLIPVLVLAIIGNHFRVAFAVFLLAGMTDALDGLLARVLQQHTRLGQFLDPIADKLMLSTLFLTLTHVSLIPRYVTSLVFSRDLGILLIASILFFAGSLRDFIPSLIGKLNTVVQIGAITVILFARCYSPGFLEDTRSILLRTIAILAPLSAAQYGYAVLRRMPLREVLAS